MERRDEERMETVGTRLPDHMTTESHEYVTTAKYKIILGRLAGMHLEPLDR